MKKTFPWIPICICIFALLLAVKPVEAKVSAEEAKKLTDGTLTPLGADPKGNEAGTIPPWTGGITEWPAGFKDGDRQIDPYADDKILFTITAANAAEHADKLSAGQLAMFQRYPNTWKMNVYPTRRSASYPQRIYDWAVKNATTAELAEGGNGVRNAAESVPFPIPKEGLEVIWNHLMRFRNDTVLREYASIAPTAGGEYTVVTVKEQILFPYSAQGATVDTINNILIYFLQEVTAPSRLAGQILLVHETLDQIKEPRRAWTYNPGQRRVRLAPQIAYDNPGTASDGQRTSDQLDMFNGAPDRYNWKLVGKKEFYVPYNAYKIHDAKYKYKDIIQAGHVNPDLLRYELHRVWVVEATLKEGTRHIYHKRVFHCDEDSWSALLVDNYDARLQIWRPQEGHVINYYDLPMVGPTMETVYDLQNGRYLAMGMTNEGTKWSFKEKYSPEMFTPAEVRRMGRR
jgi:Protein of unknown function (DUF1329)